MNRFQRLLLRLFFRKVTAANLPLVASLEDQVRYYKIQESEWMVAYRILLAEAMELRHLVLHCHIHSGYPECGYLQMATPQKKLYCEVAGAEFDPLAPRLAESLTEKGKDDPAAI